MIITLQNSSFLWCFYYFLIPSSSFWIFYFRTEKIYIDVFLLHLYSISTYKSNLLNVFFLISFFHITFIFSFLLVMDNIKYIKIFKKSKKYLKYLWIKNAQNSFDRTMHALGSIMRCKFTIKKFVELGKKNIHLKNILTCFNFFIINLIKICINHIINFITLILLLLTSTLFFYFFLLFYDFCITLLLHDY